MKLVAQPRIFCRVALFHLEEYESAKAAFERGQALDPKNSTFKTWIRKCAAEIDGNCLYLSTSTTQADGCISFLRFHLAQSWTAHTVSGADEAAQDTQTATPQPSSKSAAPNGFSSSPFDSQTASPASVLNGAPNGDTPMPPAVDPNLPKYRSVCKATLSWCQCCFDSDPAVSSCIIGLGHGCPDSALLCLPSLCTGSMLSSLTHHSFCRSSNNCPAHLCLLADVALTPLDGFCRNCAQSS